MSAPNKNYDPVQVTALSPDEVQRMLDDALAAIAKAADLDELKAARLAHAGDRAPITLANAEIGALPPASRPTSRWAGMSEATTRAPAASASATTSPNASWLLAEVTTLARPSRSSSSRSETRPRN